MSSREYRSYLELPVMIKASFGDNDFRPYIMGGGTIAYNLSAEVEGFGLSFDIEDFIEDFDFGVGFGGGISIATGDRSMFVEVRYALGLTNILDDPDIELKTSGIQIFGGITF